MSRESALTLRTRIAVIGQALCAITRLSLGPSAAEVLGAHIYRRLRTLRRRTLRRRTLHESDIAAIIRSYGELLGIALQPEPSHQKTQSRQKRRPSKTIPILRSQVN